MAFQLNLYFLPEYSFKGPVYKVLEVQITLIWSTKSSLGSSKETVLSKDLIRSNGRSPKILRYSMILSIGFISRSVKIKINKQIN